ncbi:MAG: hypothetical protein PQ612_04705 [Rickettsiales bacterium]|nr:hypothetical protein [Pseudomonadota bacterium]MDA0966321.1 hypothetical protein [Pseudomonadota bacterium]MDG4543953.1 hypothetical protein [Rickettsiales bacterium]MDG4545447.1 hypothetical protein [Rickettsiales bacterium]MDG4547896.1 hypothetical protein [Rickettsiales bacterium]
MKQDTNFEKKEKPVKKPKEARNLFWEDENKLQNVQSDGGHRRLVRQRSQPVLWVEKEEPFSRRTLEELKKIGEEFAKLSKPSGFER